MTDYIKGLLTKTSVTATTISKLQNKGNNNKNILQKIRRERAIDDELN